jgi:hypothetical protein
MVRNDNIVKESFSSLIWACFLFLNIIQQTIQPNKRTPPLTSKKIEAKKNSTEAQTIPNQTLSYSTTPFLSMCV